MRSIVFHMQSYIILNCFYIIFLSFNKYYDIKTNKKRTLSGPHIFTFESVTVVSQKALQKVIIGLRILVLTRLE